MIGKINVDGRSYYPEVSDVCPHCHKVASLELLSVTKVPELNECGLVLYCRKCKRISFADLVLAGKVLSNDETKLYALYPNPKELEIPPEMKLYYPQFYETYRQAHCAEENGLQKINGMAYRKALEELVKIYLTAAYPADEQTILNESLAKSIARIEYPRIKALAKVAAWIGNDETHTVKKNPELSVDDMKNFIVALCHLILAEQVGNEAVNIVSRA